jgi:hypothetical protein
MLMFSIPRCFLTSYWLLAVARGSTIVHDILVHHFFIARFNDPIAPWSLNSGRTVQNFQEQSVATNNGSFLEHMCLFI